MEKYPPFRWAMRPWDTQEEVFYKKLVTVCVLSICLVFPLAILPRMSSSNVLTQSTAYPFILTGLLMSPVFVDGVYRPLLAEVGLYSFLVNVILEDYLFTLFQQNAYWPWAVIIIDVCLVLRLPSRVARNIICCTLIWLTLRYTETAFRFGLYDAWYTPSQGERRDISDDFNNCTSLPCKRDVLVCFSDLVNNGLLFLLDFYFTRGFASSLNKERDKMDKVIKTAEHIADSLSKFDLAQAESVLNTSELPEPMHDAFSRILDNLRSYRPYLPEALFSELTITKECEVPAPGLISQRVAMVFTDIQGSTATWEACPDGMKEGLRVHNKVMRECAVAWNGYEVKTIGDAFMVAFEHTCDAVSFSLSVQESLVEAVWPVGLLQLDHCSYNDDGPWCGLRVRIGVHCGEVDAQLNTLTGRYDYFGNTVNKAARMEGACIGGAVAVTPEVMEDLQEGELLSKLIVISMGPTTLKGIEEVMDPKVLLPSTLEARTVFVMSQLLLSKEDRKLVVTDALSIKGSLSNSSLRSSILVHNCLRKVLSATVCKADIVLPLGNGQEVTSLLNELLAKVTLCVERTHGVVISLQGSRVALGWNASRPCRSHVESAFAFSSMLRHSYGGDRNLVHLGLSDSLVFHGSVGSDSLFVAVVGSCLGVSDALCTMGMQRGLYCLYGSSTEYSEASGVSLELLEHNLDSNTNVYMVATDERCDNTRWASSPRRARRSFGDN